MGILDKASLNITYEILGGELVITATISSDEDSGETVEVSAVDRISLAELRDAMRNIS